MNLIPAIEEKKVIYLRYLELLNSFWYSQAQIAKRIWVNKNTVTTYKTHWLVCTYLDMIASMRELILSHLNEKKTHYELKIEDIENLINNL